MRIVYLHQHFRTPAENGGVRSFLFARALAERGHEVHVIAGGAGRDGVAGQVRMDGFDVHYLDVPYDNTMGNARRLAAFASFAYRASWLARRLGGAVVIATSTPLTIAIPGIIATVGRPTRFVFEVRDLWPEVPIALGALRNPALRWMARALERAAYARASTIVALSDDMAAGAARVAPPGTTIEVITNIADIDFFDPAKARPSAWLSEHPEFSGRRLAVYCGTFGRVNGVASLVELASASLARGSDLAFVALGEGAEKSGVVEAARRAGVLGRNLFILPAVAKSGLPDVLAAASVAFSFVIDVEVLEANSANKFFDTLAASTPMVINHGGWQAEVLARTGAGLRLSRDADTAARQLDEFVGDDRALAAAGRAAGSQAREAYSLDELARRFCAVVERQGDSPG